MGDGDTVASGDAPTYKVDLDELKNAIATDTLVTWVIEHGDDLLAELELHRQRDISPDPALWPECGVCGEAFALRRALSFSKGMFWTWMVSCKHKTAMQTAKIVRRQDPA